MVFFNDSANDAFFSLLWLRLIADDVPRLIIIACVADDVSTAVGTSSSQRKE